MPRSYRTVYVPVDNSGHSFAAIDLAVDLAAKFDASVVGSHVFAAGVTDSYLDLLEECCRTASVRFERKMFDGRQHHRMILEDIRRSHYDLVVMGALGEGAVDESQIGSVAERVARGSMADVLIVKDLLPDAEGSILACVDGSGPSRDAVSAAVEFSRSTGRSLEGLVVSEGRMSVEATSALEAAREAAAAEGTEIPVTVCEGKPFDRILKLCRERKPWLLVLGRTGAGHESSDDAGIEGDLGSTTSNLLRMVPCNVLVTPNAVSRPSEAAGAAAATAIRPASPAERRLLRWTREAERLLEDVPGDQRPEVIRTVEEGARRLGITVVTAETIDKVMLGYIDS